MLEVLIDFQPVWVGIAASAAEALELAGGYRPGCEIHIKLNGVTVEHYY